MLQQSSNKVAALNWVQFGSQALFFLFIFALLFSRAMNYGLSHDEYQFVASGQLFESKLLLPYVDYPFLHMPYMAFANAPVLKLTEYDLLAARGFSALCATLSAVLIFYLADKLLSHWRQPYRSLTGAFAVLLFVTNPIFRGADGLALNHSLPALLSLAAFMLYYAGARKSRPELFFFLSGLMVGLAAGTRLSYAVLLGPFLGAVFLFPFDQALSSRLRGVFSFSAGVFLALLPAFFLFILAPQEFYYGNYVYFRLNTIYRELLQHEIAMTTAGKLGYFYEVVLKSPINLAIYTGVLIFSLAAAVKVWMTKEQRFFELALVGVLSLFLLLSAFAPTPSWSQYFFAPLPFLVTGLLYGLSVFSHNRPYLSGIFLTLLVGITLTNGTLPGILRDLSSLNRPENWQPVHVHRFASQLSSLVGQGKVLTLAPIIPLEAGMNTYEMFAVGPFSWRTAYILSEQKRREYGVIAHTELEEFLKDQPPEAILVGFEGYNSGFTRLDKEGVESPFRQYAMQNGYQPLEMPAEFTELEILLWVRE